MFVGLRKAFSLIGFGVRILVKDRRVQRGKVQAGRGFCLALPSAILYSPQRVS